ncbi:unnamed protein product [Rotaria sp. Silwood1]|nr:unnamed protein product [Rotaria sp. Silwood1]CAF4662249.1 unnamed protein product [Rotaria sp. Silwood1]
MTLLQHNRLRFFILGIIFIFMIKFNFMHHKVQNKNIFKGTKNSCNLSMIESDQLICESDEIWQKRRAFYSEQHDRNILTMNDYENYFYKNWFPEFQCPNETRLGEGDGGKWACDIEYLKSKSPCLIYSLGSDGDFQFEETVHKRLPHCSIHTIDMRYFECPKNVCKFHQIKLGDGQNKTTTLRQLMTELNQTNFEIDILKVDIEYGEYILFHKFFSNNILNQSFKPVYIRQILIEVHLDRDRIIETNALFYLFNSQNYVIYHRELNPGFPYYACEYGLLKLNRKFFRGHF